MACLLNPARRAPSRFCTAAAPAIAFAAATFVIGVAGAAADTGAGAGEVVLAAATRGAAAGSVGEAFGAAPDVYARDEGLAVRSRPHPEYDPLGVRLGAFLVFPRLVATVEGDDNILATPTNTVSDAVFAFAPGFLARSDWNQNAVSLDANLVARQYVAHTAQDSVQYAVDARGVLDVRRDLTVLAAVSHERTLLPRTSDGYALESATPLLYDETAAHIETRKVFDRLRLDGTVRFEDDRYHDGLSFGGHALDETFRDRDLISGDLRADYALSGAVGLFVEETVTHVTRQPTLGGRDATRTLFGPNFELTRLIVGEIGVGYLTSDSTARGARSVGHLAVQGRLEYFPTPLITFTLTGGQGVVDSGLPNTPAYLSSVLAFRADYELLRNLILSAEAGGVWNRYEVIDRQDHGRSFGFGATYRANRGVEIGVSCQRLRRTSSGAGAGLGFTDDTLSLSITLRR